MLSFGILDKNITKRHFTFQMLTVHANTHRTFRTLRNTSTKSVFLFSTVFFKCLLKKHENTATGCYNHIKTPYFSTRPTDCVQCRMPQTEGINETKQLRDWYSVARFFGISRFQNVWESFRIIVLSQISTLAMFKNRLFITCVREVGGGGDSTFHTDPEFSRGAGTRRPYGANRQNR